MKREEVHDSFSASPQIRINTHKLFYLKKKLSKTSILFLCQYQFECQEFDFKHIHSYYYECVRYNVKGLSFMTLLLICVKNMLMSCTLMMKQGVQLNHLKAIVLSLYHTA